MIGLASCRLELALLKLQTPYFELACDWLLYMFCQKSQVPATCIVICHSLCVQYINLSSLRFKHKYCLDVNIILSPSYFGYKFSSLTLGYISVAVKGM